MSQSPPDPFQHHNNTNHSRHPSLPTVYENNDPYRIIRKSPRIGSISDNSSDFDTVHSRSASDSSATRLLHTLPSLTNNTEFHDDPYASKKKWRSSIASSNVQQSQDERANSYLPYSHHKRDPNQKNEPIYIEEYSAPASTTLGMGSMLQDSMTDQINRGGSSYQPNRLEDPNIFTDKMVNLQSEMKKKKRQRKRCCGLRYRTVAFITAVFLVLITLIIFFVWPRIPDLKLIDVDNVGSIQVVTNSTKKSYATIWSLNMTADNHANWVPTRISSIDFTFVDNETQEHFGNATASALLLQPKADTSFNVTMPIYYESSRVNDTTFQNLYDACGVQVTSNTPSEYKQDKLNVTLYVTYHIAGIAWPTRKQMKMNDLVCPTS